MKLYLKQKFFSWGDKFHIYDQNGSECYCVKGEVFTIGKKLHLYDQSGTELAYIYQKVFSFLPKYYIYKNSIEVAQVRKEFTFFKQEYTVDGLGWQIKGDFFAHEYEIYDNLNQVVVQVSKEWFTLGDAYEIDISNRVDTVSALAVVLVIDACLENRGGGASFSIGNSSGN